MLYLVHAPLHWWEEASSADHQISHPQISFQSLIHICLFQHLQITNGHLFHSFVGIFLNDVISPGAICNSEICAVN